MGATREAIQTNSGAGKHALEAGEAAAAEVEKLMKNPLRHLDFYSRVRQLPNGCVGRLKHCHFLPP